MSLNEIWLLREHRTNASPEWSQARRERYLVVRTVRQPCSVDQAVWPVDANGSEVFVSVVNGRPNDARIFGAWNRVEVRRGVERLGYDVADETMTSALMNCGFTGADAGTAAASWGARLNERHLFRSVEDALAFRAEAELRIPEHAPFFVYGLYR